MKENKKHFEESGRLSKEYSEYEPKHKPKLESDLAENEPKIFQAKDKLDKAKLLPNANVLELFKDLELAQIHSRQLLQDYLNGKEKIGTELMAINGPYKQFWCEDLLREFHGADGMKKFQIIVDKEDPHSDKQGSRIFEVSHNYFGVHECQQRILAAVEKIKGMDTESLSAIKKVYDETLASIPDNFEMVTTKGNSEFRIWIFDNKPKEIIPDLTAPVWLHTLKLEADLLKQQSTINYWSRITKRNKSHQKPIIDVEIDMTYLYK